MKSILHNLFADWEKNIARPILVTLTTAVILFASSLSFAPVRQFLFPPKGVLDYPLYCVAEPYKDSEDASTLKVDFFIVNRTREDHTRDSLMDVIRVRLGESDASPDIRLNYLRRIGNVSNVYLDEEFNRNKGDIDVRIHGNEIHMRIDHILDRAIIKVTIVVDDLSVEHQNISRITKGSVPFDMEKYEVACHHR